MGVPVVTKLGKGVTTRAAGLSAIGLSDWIASNQNYLEIAARPTKEHNCRLFARTCRP
jgi:hypothetical protein